MGVYFKLACDQKRECLEPGHVNNGGIKLVSITDRGSAFGALAVFAMAKYWGGLPCRIVDDCGDDDGYFAYRDVTREIVERYNELHRQDGDPVKYTGREATPPTR